MKPTKILAAGRGLDVISPETALPEGAVRVAENITLDDAGQFARRDGYALDLALAQADSLWAATQRALTLVKAGDTLYRVTGKAGALVTTAIATGLWSEPAYYAELGQQVYVQAGQLLRIDLDDTVHTPGVASLLGQRPMLQAITGGLAPGKYGVAFSYVNALGEESGLSDMATIEFTASAGIMVVLPPGAPAEAVHCRIYRTEANGDVLYMAEQAAADSIVTLAGGVIGAAAETWMRDLLPYGARYLGAYNGRLYCALGRFLFYSEVYSPGLTNPRTYWIPFESSIGMVLPVDTGIFVGTEDAVMFLAGGGPGSFEAISAAANGVIPGTGTLADAAMFNAELVQGQKQVAVWLSPNGFQIGLATGQVLSPQADRIQLTAAAGRTAVLLRDGVKQLVTAVDEVTLGSGGAADSTP